MGLRQTRRRFPGDGRFDLPFRLAHARLHLQQRWQLRAAPEGGQRRERRLPLLRIARAGGIRRRLPDPLQRRRGQGFDGLRQETLAAGGGRGRPGGLGGPAGDDQPELRIPRPARRLCILLFVRIGRAHHLGRRRRVDLPPRPHLAGGDVPAPCDGRIRHTHGQDRPTATNSPPTCSPCVRRPIR